MCGIFGIVYRDGKSEPSEESLRRSAQLLSHRGPDGAGIYHEAGIGLAHTRLSLVDLDARSDQPLWDQEGRYCLVYNGEIYNFRELRENLTERGVVFRTTSDTEVLLHCLILDGAEHTLPRLQGMFALAFFDKQARNLLLARDRFGIKPLFIYRDEERFLFASEVKAMQPWIKLRPNGFHMIRCLMHFGQPTRNSCFFENIEIVPSGSMIRLAIGEAPRIDKFIDLPDMLDPALSEELEGLGQEQVVDRVDELLQQSVEQMLFADAPVGALCSGGVDSSLLMAMAARRHSNLAIFHADVVGPLSECEAATQLAKHLKLDLLTVETRDTDFIALTPEVLYHYEQPYAGHQHSVPFMMVAKLVRDNGVKGVLTGEGADECFLGYGQIAQEPFWEFYDRQVQHLRRLVRAVPAIGHRLWHTADRGPQLIGEMLGQFEVTVDKKQTRELYAERMGGVLDRNVRTLDLLGYHVQTLLHRNDTMGMAASIEARFPFLDEKLVVTAINLPYRDKIRFSPSVWDGSHPFIRDKWVLRRVADRYLPKALSQRKKRGFPVSAFRRMHIRRDFFKKSFVTDYFKLTESEFDLLIEDADQPLKTRLMMLEAWGQLFFGGLSPEALQERLRQYLYF